MVQEFCGWLIKSAGKNRAAGDNRVWPAIGALDAANIKPEQSSGRKLRPVFTKCQKQDFAPAGCRKLWATAINELRPCFACFVIIRGDYY